MSVVPKSNVPVSTADRMLEIALEKGASLEQLEKLMDLKERHDANEARKAFSAAMAAFRVEAPQIEKNAEVDYTFNGKRTNYRHASLDYICSKINPVLGKHGLTFSWETEQHDKLITVHCDVSHVLGHKQRTTLTASPDESGGKNSVQGIGSTVSYLSRYTLMSALGLATGGQDDDARQAPAPEVDESLLADLRAAADEGKDALMAAWNGLDEAKRKTLGGHLSELKRRAKEAEGASANS